MRTGYRLSTRNLNEGFTTDEARSMDAEGSYSLTGFANLAEAEAFAVTMPKSVKAKAQSVSGMNKIKGVYAEDLGAAKFCRFVYHEVIISMARTQTAYSHETNATTGTVNESGRRRLDRFLDAIDAFNAKG